MRAPRQRARIGCPRSPGCIGENITQTAATSAIATTATAATAAIAATTTIAATATAIAITANKTKTQAVFVLVRFRHLTYAVYKNTKKQ